MAKQCVHYGCNEPVYYEGATLCEAHIHQQNAKLRIEGDNFIGRCLSYFGAACIAASLVLAVVYGVQGDAGKAVFALMGGIVTGMLFIGMAEIIRLLQRIGDKR